MDPQILFGICLFIDSSLIGIFSQVPRLRTWVDDNLISALAGLVAVIGIEIALFPILTQQPISVSPPAVTVIPTTAVAPSATPTPLAYDFERDYLGWGEHPEGDVQTPGLGVEVYCDSQVPIKNTGECSLKFMPTRIINNNAYVTVLENAQNSVVTAYVFVPPEARTCTSQACSTAKIIVWDHEGTSHESEYKELRPGTWRSISWNLSGKPWPPPLQEFGVHFYLATEYEGPFYLDTVTVRK